MSYKSPQKTPKKSQPNTPQKVFGLTNTNLSGQKKERPKSVNKKKEQLESMYAKDRDEVLQSTLKEINSMKNDRFMKVINKSSKYSTTKDHISAIERHKRHFDDHHPDVHDLLKEKPDAIFDQIGVELKKHIIKDLMEDLLYKKKMFSEADENALTEQHDDDYEYVKEIIVANLNNDEKREKLLEEGLFREIHTEYVHDKKERILEEGMKRLNIYHSGARQPGAENIQQILKPSHIRKAAGETQSALYSFQKANERKKQMNLIKLALKTSKDKDKLQEQRKMNLETLKCLLSFKKSNKRRVKNTAEFECMKVLRRVYTTCAHRDISENKYVMNEAEFVNCIKKTKLHPTYLKEEEVTGIFYDLTKHYEKEIMDFYAFIEALKKISMLLIDDDVEDDCENSEKDTNDVLLLHLYEEFLDESLDIFKHPNQKLAETRECQAFLKKHHQLHSFLFHYFTRERQKNGLFEAPQEPMLTFDKVFDMFTVLQLFPSKCEKLLIRFYFEYASSDEHGLDFEDFCLFLPMIGLDIVDRYIRTAKAVIRPRKNSYEEESDKCEEKRYKPEEPLTPFEKVVQFYTSPDFLNEVTGIKEKVRAFEENKLKRQLNPEERFYIKNQFTENILSYLNTKSMI